MTCTCTYNTQRKGLTEEDCLECYQAFIDKEARYAKMLEAIKRLQLDISFRYCQYVTMGEEEFEDYFGGCL